MSNEETNNETLLQDLQAGDRDALATLFHNYRGRLGGLVRLYMDPRLAPRIDPSDVLQEAYLDAARQVDRYIQDPAASFYVWIRGITINRLHNLHRTHLAAGMRSLRRQVRLPAESSVLLAARLLAGGTTPSGAVIRQEQQRMVQEAVAELRPDDREVILMRHFEGLSNNEVAEALGLAASGATMRYGRALERLKDSLQTLVTGESRT